MRLDFRNIGKGLEAIAGAKKARDLAQESARYDVTEGAYGPELDQNIEQLRGLQAQDPAQAAIYDQSIQELERRRGLTAPDYSAGSRETNFGTRQEARQAAAPMRAEGLANVYRRYGDVDEADKLEARAFEQQRSLTRAKREDELFPLQRQQLEGQIASQAQQQKLGDLTLKDRERLALEQQNADAFQAFAAQNQNATVQELKDAAFKQFKFTPKQWQDTVATRLQIETGEMDSFKNSVKKKLQGKTTLSQYGELYNTDPDFDDKTDLAIVPGKKGAVTLNFVDKATGRVTGSETFDSQAKAIEYLNKQATEPETIGTWMSNLRTKEAQMAQANRANQGGGTPSLSQKIAATETALGRKLTNEEKAVMAGLTNKPGLGGDKPVEVQEAGIRVMVGGQLRVTDGEGGYVAPGGVVPAERAAVLQQVGVPDNLIGQIDWSPDGRTIGFRGTEYNPKNPRDVAKLNDAYRSLGANDLAVEEAQRRTPAEQARIRAQRGLGAQPGSAMQTDQMFVAP